MKLGKKVIKENNKVKKNLAMFKSCCSVIIGLNKI